MGTNGEIPDTSGVEPCTEERHREVLAEAELPWKLSLAWPLSEAERDDLVSLHRTWLADHRHLPHSWIPLCTNHSPVVPFTHYWGRSDDQASLSLRDLRGLSFSGVDLQASQLVAAIADGVDFTNATLEDSFGCDMRARGATFDGARLARADFSRSDFTGASFRNADCSSVDFEDCMLDGADFTDANLEGARNVPEHVSRRGR